MRPYFRPTPRALRSGEVSVRRPWQGESEGGPTRRKASTVPEALSPYDRAQESPAKQGNVVGLRPPPWDWSFETDGALALAPAPDPEPGRRLKEVVTSASVPRMAQPQAPGLAYRAAERQAMRARVRRARRTAALAVVACVCLVVLLLTAFGSGKPTTATNTGPAPAGRLLPAGPPSAQIIALQDTLRIQMPVNQNRVTAIGYHSSGTTALPLDPIGTQANAGLLQRMVHRFFGDSSSGIRYYQISGGAGSETGGLDVGAPTGTDVYAPVDGSVMAVSDQIVNGKPYGVRIDIQPSGNPGVVVTLTNLRADPALTVGTTVSAGRTKVGQIIDLSSVEQAALAHYTQDHGQHVHIEVHPAGSLAVP
jgi:murein DD-endopeptidase MepM/ murein hydrolase activator NlpD